MFGKSLQNYFSTILSFKVYFFALNAKEEIAQGTISSFCINIKQTIPYRNCDTKLAINLKNFKINIKFIQHIL